MGNGRGEKPLFAGLESPAIAHNERVASARFATFGVPERDFPGNRSPPPWKFVCRQKRKICAPGEAARFQRQAAHRFYPKQQRSSVLPERGRSRPLMNHEAGQRPAVRQD
jgi:hypothetical protein